VYLHDYATVRALEAGLAKFFRFYNDERIHAALDYLTPAMVYAAAYGIQRSHRSGPNQGHFSRKKFGEFFTYS
jgi:transposase InsO family protein